MTLETLITFLTIENNNINNYIVTFDYRVMVTAFAILAMFCLFVCPAAGAKLVVIKSLDQAHRNTLLEDSENPLPSDPDRDLFHKEIQCWRNRCISGR